MIMKAISLMGMVLLLSSVVKGRPEIQCKNTVQCPCGSSNTIFKFCNNEKITTGSFCKRLSRCVRCEDYTNECLECPKGIQSKYCDYGKTRSRRQSFYFRQEKITHDFVGYSQEKLEESLASCTDPGVDPNGKRIPEATKTFVEGDRLVYTCNEAYVIRGEKEIFCLNDGKWSSATPTCQLDSPELEVRTATCTDPGVGRNGKRIPETSRTFIQGDRLTYSCNDEYVIKGETELFCLRNGEWSSAIPTCELDSTEEPEENATFCPDPGVDPNGERLLGILPTSRGFIQGARIQYSCIAGYSILGESEIFCLSTGNWSAEIPFCELDLEFTGCGVSYADAFIYNSTTATELQPAEWPWHVTLSTGKEDGDECSATLLNTNTVITAANCALDDTIFLYFGRVQANASEEDPDLIIRVSTEIIIHPKYIEMFESGIVSIFPPPDGDIALIKFAPRISYSEKILPMCLPTNETTEEFLKLGHFGFLAGYALRESEVEPRKLMFGVLPIIPREYCQLLIFSDDDNSTINQFCAGSGRRSYQSYCLADKGTAFAFYNPSTDSYVMEGIVTLKMEVNNNGSSCNSAGRLLVLQKVHSYLPWIYENLWD